MKKKWIPAAGIIVLILTIVYVFVWKERHKEILGAAEFQKMCKKEGIELVDAKDNVPFANIQKAYLSPNQSPSVEYYKFKNTQSGKILSDFYISEVNQKYKKDKPTKTQKLDKTRGSYALKTSKNAVFVQHINDIVVVICCDAKDINKAETLINKIYK